MLTRSVRTDIPGRSTPCVDEHASRNSIHAPRGSPVIHLEEQAPLLRGCPDRGGERPAKGGAHALHSNVWGDARKARRVPRQIKKKGCRSAALFLYLAERGGFEPPRRYKRLPDFESGTFNHSATSPGGPRRTGDAHHTRK